MSSEQALAVFEDFKIRRVYRRKEQAALDCGGKA